MTINPELLQNLAEKISSATLNETLISAVRSEYPGIHFTYCMEDDIPNHDPIVEHPGFNLYLVDGRDHCLCLTRNFDHATGIVIAEVIPD
ncbi:hypothetical protein KEF85_00360 [Methylomonas paludis]|uniref:DUF6129 domain-containing protein n=1 Tax=Methylomonas paludis TaxID=1173101 RepID=A0A975MNE5_9GAMM|nr:DUF6129 family protein [Methylomonas paludis]QWF70990.1 hypothetical protein KEF85_00360 [Methylomonas paludis]